MNRPAPYEISGSLHDARKPVEEYRLREAALYDLRLFVRPARIGIFNRRDGFKYRAAIIDWGNNFPRPWRRCETREEAAILSLKWAQRRQIIGHRFRNSQPCFVRILTDLEVKEKRQFDSVMAELDSV